MSELDDALELGRAVQQLRIAYEQYFAGVERLEPQKERDRLKKELRRLMGSRSNNTAYKFRLQTTQATFLTLETYWDRITRQIEEGTFKRDKLKAARRSQVLADASEDVELLDDAEEVDAYEELDASDALAQLEADDGESAIAELLGKGLLRGVGAADVAQTPVSGAASARSTSSSTTAPMSASPATSPRPAAATASSAAATRPSATPPSGSSPAAASQHPSTPTSAASVAAASMAPRPRPTATPTGAAPGTAAPRPAGVSNAPRPAAPAAGAPTAAAKPDPELKKLHDAFVAARAQTGERAVSMDALAETVRKQSAAVKAQLGCERVEFKVAIKDGKAVLKAVPK